MGLGLEQGLELGFEVRVRATWAAARVTGTAAAQAPAGAPMKRIHAAAAASSSSSVILAMAARASLRDIPRRRFPRPCLRPRSEAITTRRVDPPPQHQHPLSFGPLKESTAAAQSPRCSCSGSSGCAFDAASISADDAPSGIGRLTSITTEMLRPLAPCACMSASSSTVQ